MSALYLVLGLIISSSLKSSRLTLRTVSLPDSLNLGVDISFSEKAKALFRGNLTLDDRLGGLGLSDSEPDSIIFLSSDELLSEDKKLSSSTSLFAARTAYGGSFLIRALGTWCLRGLISKSVITFSQTNSPEVGGRCCFVCLLWSEGLLSHYSSKVGELDSLAVK